MTHGTSASRWKFPAVYTWSDSEETIRNYYGRDLKPHARTTATADRAHGSSARDARARDATDEQYSRTGAPGAHRPGRRRAVSNSGSPGPYHTSWPSSSHLRVVLHPFGGHRKPQRVRKVHDQAHDSIVHRVFTQR